MSKVEVDTFRHGTTHTTENGATAKPTVEEFEKELTHLINRHSIENVANMPDFLLARMICRMIEAMGPSIKNTLDWHSCDSVCHPSPNNSITGALNALVGLSRCGKVDR